MLGLLHRSVLGVGPRHLRGIFCVLHRQLFRNVTSNFVRTGAPTIYKCWHVLPSDLVMFIICSLDMWLSRRA